jgi:hypothetical protein
VNPGVIHQRKRDRTEMLESQGETVVDGQENKKSRVNKRSQVAPLRV